MAFSIPPSLRDTSPIANATPRNATGHGKGEREIHYLVPVIESIHTSLPYFALQSTRGEGAIHF